MTRDDVVRWLDARRPAPPAALRRRLAGAVEQLPPAPDSPLPDYLATLGRHLLSAVTADAAAGRDRALDLLAADALVTYAFEAQADADVAGLATLAERA